MKCKMVIWKIKENFLLNYLSLDQAKFSNITITSPFSNRPKQQYQKIRPEYVEYPLLHHADKTVLVHNLDVDA